MFESAVTSKGRTTLRKAVREALGIAPGDRLRYVVLDDGQVLILPVRPVSRLFDKLKYRGRPVTLEDMERAGPACGPDA